MRSSINIALIALVAASSVAAHGKVAVITGDQGGNGTALGIQGGVVPGPGTNKVTEVDTTVFKGADAAGCGKTKAGPNDAEAGTKQAMALSGGTMPMISPGGSVQGTIHVVTSDGFGAYKAMIDETGMGDFTNAKMMTVTTNVPGTARGNGKKTQTREFVEGLLKRAGIMARATNINEDFPIAATVPAGTQCTGTVAGQSNVCMVKFINPSPAGPFGGCVPVQMVAPGAAAAPAAAAAPPAARSFKKLRV